MIYFNDKNIFVGQIKQLLHSFNLPQCRVYRDDIDFSEGEVYIKGNAVYLVTKNENNQLVHKLVNSYKFGDKIENLTKTLDLRNNIYDNHTHNYLGNYLRFIRDYTGVDLMSMYNCFGYEVPRNLNVTVTYKSPYGLARIESDTLILGSSDEASTIDEDTINLGADIDTNGSELILNTESSAYTDIDVNFNSNSTDYTIYMLSVHFGEEYTIAIDCSSPIEMFCGFYDNGRYLKSTDIFSEHELENATFFKSSTNRFKHPFKYSRLKEIDKFDLSHEKNLRLFIKIPKVCESSVVILEGDYIKDTETYFTYNKKQVLGNNNRRCDNEEGFVDANFTSKRQLLSMNTRGKFLLADKLVEYLTEQAITPNDPLLNNIKRLQIRIMQIIKEEGYNIEVPFKYYGIWDDRMRDFIFTYMEEHGYRDEYEDLLYYLDKDVEWSMKGLPLDISDTIGDVQWKNK